MRRKARARSRAGTCRTALMSTITLLSRSLLPDAKIYEAHRRATAAQLAHSDRTETVRILFHRSAADDGDEIAAGSGPRIGEGAFDPLAQLQAVARREAVLAPAPPADHPAPCDP